MKPERLSVNQRSVTVSPMMVTVSRRSLVVVYGTKDWDPNATLMSFAQTRAPTYPLLGAQVVRTTHPDESVTKSPFTAEGVAAMGAWPRNSPVS
jgi:hypothetical protein